MKLTYIALFGFIGIAGTSSAMQNNQSFNKKAYLTSSVWLKTAFSPYSTQAQTPEVEPETPKVKKTRSRFKSALIKRSIGTYALGTGALLGFEYLKNYMPATTKHVTNTVNAGVNSLKSFITKEVSERLDALSKRFENFRKENRDAHTKTHKDLDQIKKDLDQIKRKL
ncbi:hypothetical protein Noda2021_12240 [Candidatus Dependentiae bacterium Noda2021]|nr:hypothetical protein Noda2021_12240 [Candidatus Dependentiae bacterium Noda2021]